MPKDFRTLFHNVFDDNEEVKLCGREACKALIIAMEEAFPGESFGNRETGFMDIFKIKRFYHKTYGKNS